MAKKSTKFILLVVAVVLVAAVLAGCSIKFTPVPGGDPNADTISNNGIVVKQGDYYYFINGLGSYDTLTDINNNTFGTPLKGSICRVKKGATSYEDFNVVVPKVVLSKNKDASFSIFGGFIYYASPSVTTDTKGVVQVGYTDFFRCKLDGSDTEKLATVEGDALKHKFTDKGLIYVEGTSIKVIPYTANTIGKVKTIAENITSSAFTVSANYKVGVETAQDFAFYTVAIDEEGASANEVYAVNGDGSKVIKLMGKTSYTDNDSDKRNQFTITLSMAKIEPNGDVVLYYEKGGEYKVEGLFGYKLGSATLTSEFAFNKAQEKQFSNRTGITAVPLNFETGVMMLDSANGLLYIPQIEKGIDNLTARKEWKFKLGTSVSINDIIVEGNGMYILHTAAGRLEKLEMDPNGRDRAIEGDSGFIGNSYPLLAKGLSTDWQTYEIMDGEIFFFNSTYMNYTFTAKVSDISENSELGITPTFVGKMTDADKKTYDKQLKDEAEAKK